MSRELHSHKVNGCNETLKIVAVDEPGSGGANHCYQITGFHCGAKGIVRDGESPFYDASLVVNFQNGPIIEVGVNGVTNESLIAIVIDRLQGFQKGPFACRENAIALTKLEEAQHWLKHRTNERLARGVEGTHSK